MAGFSSPAAGQFVGQEPCAPDLLLKLTLLKKPPLQIKKGGFVFKPAASHGTFIVLSDRARKGVI